MSPSHIAATLSHRIANPRSAIPQRELSVACYHSKNINHFRRTKNNIYIAQNSKPETSHNHNIISTSPYTTKRTGKNPSFEKAYSAQNLLEFNLSAGLFKLSLDFLSFSLRSAFLDSLRSSLNELLSFLKTKTANVLNSLDNSHLSITE